MKLKDYLEQKKILSRNYEIFEMPYCLKCRKKKKTCLCHLVKPIKTKTYFVFLMHPMESKKERIGTGRLSHLSLTNSKIIVGEDFDKNKEVQELLTNKKYQCFILYPGKESLNIEISFPALMQANIDANLEADFKKINLVFVIDGTWACAKSMMRDSISLHTIPRISFNATRESRFFIKKQPSIVCLSTIESLYYVLKALDFWEVETLNGQQENLLTILDKMCQFQQECADNPNMAKYRPGIFKKNSEVLPSRKWLSRKITFE